MIAEFERRLADVLGTRLPAPFGGRVDVPAMPVVGDGPLLVVGVGAAEPIEPDFGSQRSEIVPGADDARRVVRLRCTVEVQARSGASVTRPQQIQALDAALYALDAPDLRDGSALLGPDDPGFLIQTMRPVEAVAALDPAAPAARPVGLTLLAEGWFWPVGVAGEAGVQIGEIRVRGVSLPIGLEPARPAPVAGGPAIDLTIRIGASFTQRLRPAVAPLAPPVPPALPFGQIAVTLVGPGGRPGAGTLSGGVAAGGIRRVTVADGAATVQYTPPAAPAVDELVVALDDGEGGLGIELGRFVLQVRSA